MKEYGIAYITCTKYCLHYPAPLRAPVGNKGDNVLFPHCKARKIKPIVPRSQSFFQSLKPKNREINQTKKNSVVPK